LQLNPVRQASRFPPPSQIKYLPRLVIVALLLAALFSGLSGASESPGEAPQKAVSPSLMKSLVVPGWGQIAEKRYVEGIFFLSAEIFCLTEVLTHNHQGNYYCKKYQAADNPEDASRLRGLTERYDKKRNIYILAAAAVWALNLLDVYFIVKSRSSQLQLNIEGGKSNLMALVVRYSF
jgi:hypothetical protein